MYGTRYILRWESEKYNHDYKILIKERDYAGEAETKALGAAPLLCMDDSDSGISGTSLEMVIQADVDGELTVLYTVDNKKFLVELNRNDLLIWTGYLLPEKYSEPFIAVPYDVSVSATDGLGILKDIPFSLKGDRNLLEIIKYCCDQTSLLLEFEFFSTLRESAMSTSNVMHTQVTLDTLQFQGNTCYEVLESCMITLDSFITQESGRWIVGKYTDLNTSSFLYSNPGILKKRDNLPRLTLGSIGNDSYPIGALESEILPASKSVKFVYDYKEKPSLLENYDFSNDLQNWRGAFISSYKRNDKGYAVISNNATDKTYLSQSKSVRRTVQDIKLVISKAIGVIFFNPAYSYPERDQVELEVKLTAGSVVYYLSDEGWKTTCEVINMSSRIQKAYSRSGVMWLDEYEDFTVISDGFPADGIMEIIICNPQKKLNTFVFVSSVQVTIDTSSGIDVVANLADKASTSHDDVSLGFGDDPLTGNGNDSFYNTFRDNPGGRVNSWTNGGKYDTFLYTILKSVCSRIGFPRRQLSGTIQGNTLQTFMLLVDKYSDTLFYVKEASFNLLLDEMNVTLEQFMPYVELSGETTESIRTTNDSASEYRSSGENETRVYQNGVGVPMRIRDLSPVELRTDSVIEVDRMNVVKSGKTTLQKVLEFILNTGNVWTKEELRIVEGYILYLGEKIKAGNSDLWDSHAFEDYLDQPVKTNSDVLHNSVTAKSFTEEDNPDNENIVSTRLVETGGGYLGDLDNVSDEANTAMQGSVLIKDQDTWIPVYPTYSEVPDHDNLLMPVFNTLTRQWLYITIPSGGVTPPSRAAFPYTFPIVLS